MRGTHIHPTMRKRVLTGVSQLACLARLDLFGLLVSDGRRSNRDTGRSRSAVSIQPLLGKNESRRSAQLGLANLGNADDHVAERDQPLSCARAAPGSPLRRHSGRMSPARLWDRRSRRRRRRWRWGRRRLAEENPDATRRHQSLRVQARVLSSSPSQLRSRTQTCHAPDLVCRRSGQVHPAPVESQRARVVSTPGHIERRRVANRPTFSRSSSSTFSFSIDRTNLSTSSAIARVCNSCQRHRPNQTFVCPL